MKKIFTKLMLLAVAATAIVSCENNFDEQTPSVELTQTVTLSADKTGVRTELVDGVPYWSAEDQIGVYVQDGETYKNYAFKNDSEESSLTTTFTGTTAVANTLFVYYPYTNFSTPVTEKGVKVEILANQEPTAASFDGRTDLMIAKPVTLDEEGKQLENLEFARVAAIVKVVLKDKTGNLAGQHVSSLTMTAETNLVGRVYLDVVNQVIFTGEGGGLYYGGAPSVNATYTEATQYEVNGENATYVVVYPQTLATGSKLSFEAVTEGYAISKEITLPSDIELLAGKVTTLNVSLAAENVVAEATGLALPVEDDFSWITSDNENGAIDTALNGDLYSSGSKVYPLNSANTGKGVKFGSSTVAGSITTVDLNLSQPFSVIFDAKKFGSDASKLQVTAGDQVLATATLVDAWTTYVLEFEAVDAKEQITIEVISAKRAYLDNLKVVAGHDYVLPPVLTVNVESITSISHEGENVTFEYSVANPVEGTSVVITDDADWITTADNNGTVTVTVAENTLEEERNATITVKYGDLTETIAIQQNAKPGEGGDVAQKFTVTYTVATTSSCTTSGTAPTGSTAAYNQTYNTKEQLTSGNSATFTLGGYTGATITGMVLNMKSNASKGAGKFSVVAGSTTLAAISTATNFNAWYDNTSFGGTFRDINVALTNDSYVVGSGENVVVKFEATTNSIYVHSITIEYTIGGSSEGGDTPSTPAPELAITTTSPIAVGAEGDVATVAYTITNPVEGQSVTASADQSWVNGFDYTVAGEVSFAVEANTGAAREATVTLSYDGAESKTVTVSQAAGNTGGGEPSTGTEVTTKYTFSNYTAGTQYAANEAHKLDDVLTITTTECHFTTELRIYSSGTHNGYAIGTLAGGATIKSLGFNAGNKVDTLNVYGSTDGSTWTLVSGVSITSTSYKDYSVDFGNTNYTYFKLDVAGTQQVRVASLTLTYVE